MIGDTMTTDILGGTAGRLPHHPHAVWGVQKDDLNKFAFYPDLVIENAGELDRIGRGNNGGVYWLYLSRIKLRRFPSFAEFDRMDVRKMKSGPIAFPLGFLESKGVYRENLLSFPGDQDGSLSTTHAYGSEAVL